jgi:hypothetical protein
MSDGMEQGVRAVHRTIQSVGATGGVYKGQGRNRCKLMTCVYWEFLVQDRHLQQSIPSTVHFDKIAHASRRRLAYDALHERVTTCVLARCVHQCSARAAQDIQGHHRPVIASHLHRLEEPSVPLRSPANSI